MSTVAKSKKDVLNDRMTAMFHAEYPDAAEQLFAVSEAKWTSIKPPVADEQAVKLGEIISRIPICDKGRASVAELVSELVGKKVEVGKPKDKPFPYRPGMLVVPTTNPNEHNYPLNKACLVLDDDDSALTIEGESGNCLPYDGEGIRAASLKETKEFVEKVADNWWHGLARVLEGDYDIFSE